jgi:hypothetical protein
MSGFDRFGGIDFSGAKQPLSNLWSAVGRERDGRLEIVDLRPHAFREDLAAHVGGAWREPAGAASGSRILWGIDVPLGLPSDLAEMLVGPGADWPRLLSWVADRPPDEIRALLPEGHRLTRATDTGGALPPLDLRLYKQTLAGLAWVHGLREEGDVAVLPQAARPGASCAIVEVYPSGAARELGLPRRRTPSRPGEGRARAAALRTFVTFSEASCEAAAVTLEDAWDAVVACLVAFLCRDDLDQPRRVGSVDGERLGLEGWIYRPPASIA